MADEPSPYSQPTPPPTPSAPDTIDERPGVELTWPPLSGPRYRPQRLHARGGLGEVHVAADAELGRTVALKRIRDDRLAEAGSVHRFLREAEITARLEHPGIVPVYGLVPDEDGQPCYAMRLVEGQTLKDAADRFHRGEPASPSERRLAFRQLLDHFRNACNAVAYAHSRGVIHRDLKPANILLGKFGETLVVDWGLAKVTGRTEATRTEGESTLATQTAALGDATQHGQAIGTPAFMPPEQAAGMWTVVSPASDLYSLGATLYYLLTGRTPFHDPAVEVLLFQVQQGKFPPPRQVKPDVPRALEAICRKAMAHEPAERYATATALAADVEHWLADEPATAYREPWVLRAGRWARRHRTLLTSTAAVLLVAALGAAAAVLLLTGFNRQLAQANAELTQSSAQLEAARQEALAQEQTAKEREAETKAVLDFVEKRVFAAARPEGQAGGLGRQVSLRQAVEAALPFVAESFPKQPLIEARLRMTLGNSFWYLGDAKTAAEQYQAARTLYTQHRGPEHPDTLNSMQGLARSYTYLGRYAEALALYEQTLALQKPKLGPDHPDTLNSMNSLALGYGDLGRHAESLALHEQTLALQKAKLGPDHPDTVRSMNNLAFSYAALGRH